MRLSRILPALMLTGLLAPVTLSHAEDIDLFSGLGTDAGIPSVLIVMDNAANFSSNSDGSSCVIDGAATALSGTVGGIEQCALHSVVKSLPTGPSGEALVNIGLMVYNANNMNDVSGTANCGAPTALGGCLVFPLRAMTEANKTPFLDWVKAWTTSPVTAPTNIKADGGATAAAMQEAWAYYAGSTGLSGRNYAGVARAPEGCQKNFVIFIGNSFSSSGTPADSGSASPKTKLETAPGVTDAQKALITTSHSTTCGNFTFPSNASTHENGGYYADEWARYMRQTDVSSTFSGQQSITTYTIGILGASCQAEYASTLISMASHGGGKYYATSNYDQLVQALLKILNEVQAVNSVFASSSLPVSVNAQGTFLNQIFMGMFRPDQNGEPRWLGNLKQYQFVAHEQPDGSFTLELGDSLGQPAISSAGTGFISPNAVSFWTSKDTTVEPDLGGGFWRERASGVGGGFDSPDGELVEKGGAAQVSRKALQTVDYSTAAGSSTNPRKLYTYCPSGSSCNAALTHSSNVFDSTNGSITDAMLGTGSRTITAITSAATQVPTSVAAAATTSSTVQISITNLSKSGNTVTATVSAADIAIINAGLVDPTGPFNSIVINTGASKYDCNPCTITGTSGNTFTYSKSGGSGTPTLPSAAAYTNSVAATSTAVTVTQASHGLSAGQKVTFSSCAVAAWAAAMNGVVYAVTNITANTFDVTAPVALAGTSDNACRYAPNVATATSVGHGFPSGAIVTISGANPAGYNSPSGGVTITVTGADTFAFSYDSAAPLANLTGTATVTGNTTRTNLIRWVRGQDYKEDEFGPGSPINVRPSLHGDVLHSRPVVINYGSYIVVFYGANDGVFRAVNGNQTGTDAGKEMWGFIPPELFGKLKRQHDNSPILHLHNTVTTGVFPAPQKKDYYIDGSTGLYQVMDANGVSTKVNIYLSMRRGGRLLYALDVTDPSAPTVLWRKSNADSNFGELGQTWSQPRAASIKGYTTNPVLIFGAGYDPAEDSEPPAASTMGRGLFVLDAQTGDPVWRAIPKASGSTTCSGTAPVTCEVVGMDYSIPADITLVDRDFDGHVDRLYAADMGGNIWRVDLQPNGLCDPVLYPSQPCDPETWKVTKIAALGCSNGPCPAGTTPRKFFYPVDILSATATHPYDLVVAGSGDREHPLDENLSYNVTNRLYALKDGVGYDASSQATITENDLVPDPETNYDQSGSGYYLTLRTGEKVVNAPRTVAGATLFSTNMPVPVDPDDSTICEANLGEARSYRINAFTGGGEYATFDGGGFPPTVVAGVVNVEVGGKTVQLPFVIGGGGSGSGLGTGIGSSETSGTIGGGLDGGGSGSCSSPSALEGCIVNVPVPATRTRTYWYFLAD